MKTEYICEVCGKRHATQKAANECEESHKTAQKKADLKARSEAIISQLVERHIITFREAPSLNISDEATYIAAKKTALSFASTLLSHIQQICNINSYDKETKQ